MSYMTVLSTIINFRQGPLSSNSKDQYAHTVYVLYFTETGKSWFYEIFLVVFNFSDGCVGLVLRCTESNFHGYLISRMAIDSRNTQN